MTIKEVFELHNRGFTEEAYSAIRKIYLNDKSKYASVCIFWIALDIFRLRINHHKIEEAHKIYLALERVLPRITDTNGKERAALDKAKADLDNVLTVSNEQHSALAPHNILGKWGENVAADYLRDKGYTIIERDWRSKHRDIDIIALHNNILVFVEVKTRSNTDFGDPEEAVHYKKQRNLRYAINHYIKRHHVDLPWRFDVVAIVGNVGHIVNISHIEDFTLSLR